MDSDDLEFAMRAHVAPAIRQAIEDGLVNGLPSEEERRRYALQQGAAVIFSGSFISYENCEVTVQPQYWLTYEEAVLASESLLAEIESREAK